jgi:hypothetical protein
MNSNLASSAASPPSSSTTKNTPSGVTCEKKLLEQIDEGLNVPLAPSQTFTSICSSMHNLYCENLKPF